MDQRRQAVGGAGGVGDDEVLGGVVDFVVDAHDDGGVFTLGRGRDDDLLGAGGDVALGLFGFGEQAGGFDHIVDLELLPGQFGRGLGRNHMDFLAVDHQHIVFGLVGRGLLAGDGAVELALGGVVLEQVGQVVSGNDVAHGDHFDAGDVLLAQSAEHETTDATETIDGDLDTHCVFLRRN